MPNPTTPDPRPAAEPEKARLRALLLAHRHSLARTAWDLEAELLLDRVVASCALTGVHAAATVCAYFPTPTEPGSPAMLDALCGIGLRVLLPIVADGPRPLGWAAYTGPESLVIGPLGIRRPTGLDLGPSVIREAALVIVPALAVDRNGVRLGRGAGWYDRSLPLARPGTALLAVVRDEEVVDELPCEPHDVLMTGVVTPTAGPRFFRSQPD